MNSAPKVVHVVISLSPGGLERLVVDWTNARNARFPGSTAICCLDAPGELADRVPGDALLCLAADRSRFPWDRGAVQRLRSHIRAWPSAPSLAGADERTAGVGPRAPVILHSHNLAAQQYAALARSGIRARHVNTQHGANTHLLSPWNRLRSRLLCHLTDGIVAVSAATARAMSRNQGLRLARIRVIPNGVSAPPAVPEPEIEEARRQCGLARGRTVIGSVGRLSPVKGYERLLEAMAPICGEAGSPVTLLLVGEGPERSYLQSLAREFGILEHVVFAGFQREPRRFLSLMSFFVLPSRSEGLSVALLEAMAAGVPVLATKVGENSAILDHGECGTLLPDEEVLWPEIILQHLSPEGRAAARARAGRAAERVKAAYSLERTLDAYEELYRELAQRG